VGDRVVDSDDRDKARAAALLAKVDALAEGFEHGRSSPSAETIPPPSADTDAPEWEDPTQQAPPGLAPPPGSLHSDEAVVGPNGLVPRKGGSQVRPPAAPQQDVRPAARPGTRTPVASGGVREAMARPGVGS